MEERINKVKNYVEWALVFTLALFLAHSMASLLLHLVERKLSVAPRMATVKKVILEKEKTKTINEYMQSLKSMFPDPVTQKSAGSSGASGGSEPGSQPELPMILMATIVGEDASLAIINVGSKDEVVKEGETVSQFHVKDIFKNKVILEKNGQERILRMKFGEQEEQTPKVSPAASPQGQDSSTGTERKEISRREFETMTNPPDAVSKTFAFAPTSREGKPYGIQLTFIKPGTLLQNLGFLQGDILKAVNSKPVYTPEEGMMAYQMMKNEDTVDFSIDRGGRFFHLQIVFK